MKARFHVPDLVCFFFKKNGWVGEKRVVSSAHPSHPRTGTCKTDFLAITCLKRAILEFQRLSFGYWRLAVIQSDERRQ